MTYEGNRFVGRGLPMDLAPRDGTMLRLLVDYRDGGGPLEDAEEAWTIGFNSFENTEEDRWQFAGWSWSQDCWCEGSGTPIAWAPFDPATPPAPVPTREEVARIVATLIKEVVFLAVDERPPSVWEGGEMNVREDHMASQDTAPAGDGQGTTALPPERPAMDPARRALFMCAAHCQGGHSAAGAEVADVLGVPFPIRMTDLIAKARAEGENPAELWTWLITAHQGRNRFFSTSEILAVRSSPASPSLSGCEAIGPSHRKKAPYGPLIPVRTTLEGEG